VLSTPTCRPPYYGERDGRDLDNPIPANAGGDGQGTSNEDSPATGNPATSGSGEGNESSACQFGPASTSRGAVSLLAVLGALFGVARRRRFK
jgi:MYXO-CTERM domain-containing protein